MEILYSENEKTLKKLAQTSLATRNDRSLIVQTMNSVRSRSLSLKYQRFTSGYKDKGVTKFEFVTKTWKHNL